jgi:hypothetical protein
MASTTRLGCVGPACDLPRPDFPRCAISANLTPIFLSFASTKSLEGHVAELPDLDQVKGRDEASGSYDEPIGPKVLTFRRDERPITVQVSPTPHAVLQLSTIAPMRALP